MPEPTLLFAPAGDLAISLIAGLFGLLFGSFLNVVIHRLPKMMQRESDNYCAVEAGKDEPHTERYNLVVPRSACPHCNHQIGALENIPVLSYLVLRGKCSNCKAPISPRYPAIELLTGALTVAVVWHYGSGWQGLGGLFFLYSLIAMTFIDADTQLLPDDLTYPLIWAGLLLNLNQTYVSLQDAVIGAAAGYLALWSVYWAYKLLRGREGMGYGDFKLLAALGAWMGWAMLPAIVLMSSLVGSVVGIVLMIVNRKGLEYQIPFGPYLAAAGLIAFLYGEPIMAFTRSVYPYF
ncbi:type 4 prepilin-like proteins leader peptide-processing protein PilD [Janthinobacterium sp. HH01]|uniref:prepilin peptidase n=1 Tax=Janthinobacterium sp. HH01 TaxID=1198452 RepID=UPI0002AEA862|nr:A24 family peptidase [Janthinobacterium sp. HH01]ELX12767.1 type 4 prepilin-like proteins leader peptide-processing protein PilD [Janthinobacterium sp. HH01]